MTKLDYLAQIVISVANNIYEDDIEEYDKGFYNLLDLPQNPAEIDRAIEMAKEHNLEVEDMRNEGYVTITAGKTSFIRFNLYMCDEKYYGNKGDINSLDMTKNVYNKIIKIK